MPKIKPVGYHVDLRYQCPICQSDLWATNEEAKTPGFRIVCCGKSLVLETVAKCSLEVIFKNQQVGLVPIKIKQTPLTRNTAQEALVVLQSLGFADSKYEAHAYELACNGHSVESIVKGCIAL